MEIEEFFAQAVDRLLAGESIDDILVVYPPSARAELRGLLAVVEAAERMATAPMPAPAPLIRVSSRLLFAQRAAELRAEYVAVQSPVAAPAAPVARIEPDDPPSLWQRLRAGWQSLLPPAPLLRLAPLTMVLLVTFLLTFTVVVTAQDALPYEQIYPLKQWMLEQRVATAPPELEIVERLAVIKVLEDDVAETAKELQNASASKPVEVIGTFPYLGKQGDYLRFGSLLVAPGYLADPTDAASWVPMAGGDELQPGMNVMLRYLIVPGVMDAVQGMGYEVVPEPTLPTPTPAPPPTPMPGGGCQRIQPRNWTRYAVRAGETLRDIAANSGASSAELRRVNCLTDGALVAGTTIFVPARITTAPQATPTSLPTATPLPPTSPPTITPTDSTGQPPPSRLPAQQSRSRRRRAPTMRRARRQPKKAAAPPLRRRLARRTSPPRRPRQRRAATQEHRRQARPHRPRPIHPQASLQPRPQTATRHLVATERRW